MGRGFMDCLHTFHQQNTDTRFCSEFQIFSQNTDSRWEKGKELVRYETIFHVDFGENSCVSLKIISWS